MGAGFHVPGGQPSWRTARNAARGARAYGAFRSTRGGVRIRTGFYGSAPKVVAIAAATAGAVYVAKNHKKVIAAVRNPENRYKAARTVRHAGNAAAIVGTLTGNRKLASIGHGAAVSGALYQGYHYTPGGNRRERFGGAFRMAGSQVAGASMLSALSGSRHGRNGVVGGAAVYLAGRHMESKGAQARIKAMKAGKYKGPKMSRSQAARMAARARWHGVGRRK